METVRVGGRRYTDPDVISLIRATGELVDPRSAVVHQARKLNSKLKHFDAIPSNAIQRMIMLASLKGLRVESMNVERQRDERRDAIIVPTATDRVILYNPRRPAGRVAFSIAHEISHTFFPNSVTGNRFRNICESSSREANELERLFDLGGSELLMPLDEFRIAAADNYSLANAENLAAFCGSSFEATVFRLATAHPGLAVAGLLRYRNRKEEERQAQRLSLQSSLFADATTASGAVPRKYRRQSCYMSDECGDEFTIRWNKSFDPSSVVYSTGRDKELHSAVEFLPNNSGVRGRIEAIPAPYQREEAHSEYGDVLFLWTAS